MTSLELSVSIDKVNDTLYVARIEELDLEVTGESEEDAFFWIKRELRDLNQEIKFSKILSPQAERLKAMLSEKVSQSEGMI